jgi:hypothetical protein
MSQAARDHRGFVSSLDGEGLLFTMYMEMAGEEDKKMSDDWKADADGILVFVSPITPCHDSLRVDMIP